MAQPVRGRTGNASGSRDSGRGSAGEGEASVLARGSRVRGNVSGDGDLRVGGEIEGDVTVSGDVSLDEGARVTGDVSAASVTVAGDVEGDVESRGAVTVQASATVRGDLTATEVVIEEGATVHGRIDADFDLPAELTRR